MSSSGPSSPNINTLEFFSHQHRCYDTNTPQPASPKFFSTAPSLTTPTTTTVTTSHHEHAHHNNPYTTRAPDTYAANDRGVSYAEMNAAAVRLLLQLNTSTKPHPDMGLPDLSAQHANVDELSSADGGVGAVENSGEMSDPASPSEGSESLGSHSQTEVASIIERGDTATPDTHSDVQDQEISCQENTEPENLLCITNNRGAASSE